MYTNAEWTGGFTIMVILAAIGSVLCGFVVYFYSEIIPSTAALMVHFVGVHNVPAARETSLSRQFPYFDGKERGEEKHTGMMLYS